MTNSTREEKDKSQEEVSPRYGIKDIFKVNPPGRVKKRPPKKLGRGLRDKRPHFKSFKSPGVK